MAPEVEHRDAEKCSRRRNFVVIELQPPCYREREDDDGKCKGVAE